MGFHAGAQEILAGANHYNFVVTGCSLGVSTGLSRRPIYLHSFLTFKMKNLILLITSFLFAELVLQGACLLSPAVDSIIFAVYKKPIETKVEPIKPKTKPIDSIVVKGGPLGHSGNPKRFDHDTRGYRNEVALEESDIVMLGDSHTYGTSVEITEAWPYLIQKELGINSYNMGLGGYGPAHNLLQLDEAIELSPKLVIIGLYFGNDFFDNFRLALHNERISAFLTNHELDTIIKLENKSKLGKEASTLFTMGNGQTNKANYNKAEDNKATSVLLRLLSQNSALYGLSRALKKEVRNKFFPKPTILTNDFEKAKAALTNEQLKYCSVFDGKGGWRTILTSPHRGLVNNRKDPRINIGFDLTSRVFLEIKKQVTSSGADLLVVLLPTKESVFSKRILNPESHIGYSNLIFNEQVNRDELKQFFEDNMVPYIDMLHYLQKSKYQPYFSNADGHPNELGHEIITDAIVKKIHDFK